MTIPFNRPFATGDDFGYIQEAIDVAVILNALRALWGAETS